MQYGSPPKREAGPACGLTANPTFWNRADGSGRLRTNTEILRFGC